MCGIIGLYSVNIEDDMLLLKELFKQSQIRGKHATGISYFDSVGNLKTHIESVPADKFVENFDFSQIKDDLVIGHCRYSTSDLEFNQPISDGKTSIVHNGVITQSDFGNWEELYGYKCEGKNDSELILRAIIDGESPMSKYNDSSMGVVTMNDDGVIRFYRNGHRPLWYFFHMESLYIASTKDILKRTFRNVSGMEIEPESVIVGHEYIYNGVGLYHEEIVEVEDKQIRIKNKYKGHERL